MPGMIPDISKVTVERIVIVGGGAAGFFAGIACASANPGCDVQILEKSAHFLGKVRISGGGRCNVTHACFDPRALSTRYARGERALIGAFHRFGPDDAVKWFENRGVPLKTEADGRIFPRSDSSQTVIDCLLREAESAGVRLVTHCGVESVTLSSRAKSRADRRETAAGEGGANPAEPPEMPIPETGAVFEIGLSTGETIPCEKLLLATGGCRVPSGAKLAESLGHTTEPPVPSLFTFHVETPWLRAIPGITVADVEVSAPGTGLRERGPLLVTHWGLSGPVILRLSAWGARSLHDRDYRFPIEINWLPEMERAEITAELQARRLIQPAKLILNTPLPSLPARLWEQLAIAAGIEPETRWNRLTRECQQRLGDLLSRTEFPVNGKSVNKEEFVTCGGVRLREVDMRTMESRVCPGLYFAGELLDIDGLTGGFNFQAAWTTGWIAGHSMAGMNPPAQI